MKLPALTIYQPWPTLLLLGVKGFETRGNPPPRHYIGKRIALHAAKRLADLPEPGRVTKAIDDALFRYRQPQVLQLPRGMVIGTAVLAGGYKIGEHITSPAGPKFEVAGMRDGSRRLNTYQPIDLFGDFTLGRWAWLFEDLQFLPEPVPARGFQSWWRWETAA